MQNPLLKISIALMCALIFEHEAFSSSSLIKKYKEDEERALATVLPTTRYTRLDAQYIDDIFTTVGDLLQHETLAANQIEELHELVGYIATALIYRNGSAASQLRSYAKQKLVCVLKEYPLGQSLLESIAAKNELFQAELEAYSCLFIS